MESNLCPSCGGTIQTDDINIQEGVGLCRACGKLSRLGDIADQPNIGAAATDLSTPPPGCSYEDMLGGGTVVRASLRSAGGAAGLLFFCLFWNGIVSVFVLLALAGLYTNLVGPLPEWFPAPSGSGKKGNIGPNMPLGMTLFLCVFLIPFVTIGLCLFAAFLTSLMGRVEVMVNGLEGKVRTGFGPVNWTRRFDPTRVRRVTAGLTSYSQNNQRKPVIQIEADRTVTFGSMLTNGRREWLIGALHRLLVSTGKGGKPPMGRRSLLVR